jgi:hypothetical protein
MAPQKKKASGMRWKSVALRASRRLTSGVADHRLPAWSPDGEHLLYAVGAAHDASWVLCDRRGRVARLIAGPAVGAAGFALDGAFAIGRAPGGFGEVWYAPTTDAPPVRLLGGDGWNYQEPALSPDGATLAFVRRSADESHLFLLDVKSGARMALPADPGRFDTHPAFSPDGQELFFEGARGDDAGIYAWAFAGGEVVRLTTEGTRSRRPAPLSLDLVVVERDDGERRKLVLVDCANARERDLSPDDPDVDQREPCVLRVAGGKVRLAFVERHAGGRFDVCAARLKAIVLAEDLTAPDLPDFPPVEEIETQPPSEVVAS